ncbi:MAG: hypothetical protein HUK14_06145 [Muribaculaceae bacterium]|nr:hypothetical protein [Muribaculaceae bacterium]
MKKCIFALTETVVSAIVIVLLYVIYIPFGIGRALFNRKAIRDFYGDVFFIIDSALAKMRKREE